MMLGYFAIFLLHQLSQLQRRGEWLFISLTAHKQVHGNIRDKENLNFAKTTLYIRQLMLTINKLQTCPIENKKIKFYCYRIITVPDSIIRSKHVNGGTKGILKIAISYASILEH